MPDHWVETMAVAGDPDECAEKIDRLIEAGSDAIGLWLFPTHRGDEVAELCAHEVLPRLRATPPTRTT